MLSLNNQSKKRVDSKKTPTKKLRHQENDYLMQSVARDANTRRGAFVDLLQACCLGILRSNIDMVIELFEWTEEEKHYLSGLLWKGIRVKGNLKTGNNAGV